MFDLETAIAHATEHCLARFSGVDAVERVVGRLNLPEASVEEKKRILVNLGILTGEIFIGPQVVHLDIVGTCNLDCIYCRDHSPWVTDRESWRDMEMDFGLFERLVDETVALGGSMMPLLGAGEPLMHTRFVDVVSKIKAAPLGFEVFTNGLLFNEKTIELFKDADRGRLSFSISGADEATYKFFRPKLKGSPLAKIEQTIRTLAQERTGGLVLIAVHVINNANYTQIVPMMERAIELGMNEVEFKLTEYAGFSGSLKLTPEQYHQVYLSVQEAKKLAEAAGVNIHDNIDYQLQHINPETGNYAENLYRKMGCHIGWDFVRVRRDGLSSFCCALKFMEDLTRTTLAEYWYSEKLKNARLASRDFPNGVNFEYAPGEMLFDEQCDYCYNYIFNFHSDKELTDLGLLPLVRESRRSG
jgi:MoaA/NifB/PqqE/SkfB family radical SAM enzyme